MIRPRADMSPEQQRRLDRLKKKRDVAEVDYRAGVVQTLLEGASFSAVSQYTGLSTNTLQRWKREAK